MLVAQNGAEARQDSLILAKKMSKHIFLRSICTIFVKEAVWRWAVLAACGDSFITKDMKLAMKKCVLLLLALVGATAICYGKKMPANVERLWHHIDSVMPQSVRETPNDEGSVIALPKPYSVPCVKGAFQEMYYWDTYFTNKGLLLLGNVEQAKNNLACITYLIEKFGYMPNGSHKGLLNRSQPPYASLMARDIYDVTRDKEWLRQTVKALEKEYDFWMTKRIAPNGLNRYGHNATNEELLGFYDAIASRLGVDAKDRKTQEADKLKAGANWLAEAESGWDFNPRYSQRCMDFNPVDLNANLYIYEKNFEYFYKELGLTGGQKWRERAQKRRRLINKYCYNKANGLFYDYDFVNKRQSRVYSGGSYNLMNAGVMTAAQAKAAVRGLGKLEMAHGIAACERGTRPLTYQWDYPNCWAAITYNVIAGLDRYGYKTAARRIAKKYLDSNVKQYNETGVLWEKYNAVTGNNDAAAEYGTPGDFMGWTAGALLFCAAYLEAN